MLFSAVFPETTLRCGRCGCVPVCVWRKRAPRRARHKEKARGEEDVVSCRDCLGPCPGESWARDLATEALIKCTTVSCAYRACAWEGQYTSLRDHLRYDDHGTHDPWGECRNRGCPEQALDHRAWKKACSREPTMCVECGWIMPFSAYQEHAAEGHMERVHVYDFRRSTVADALLQMRSRTARTLLLTDGGSRAGTLVLRIGDRCAGMCPERADKYTLHKAVKMCIPRLAMHDLGIVVDIDPSALGPE